MKTNTTMKMREFVSLLAFGFFLSSVCLGASTTTAPGAAAGDKKKTEEIGAIKIHGENGGDQKYQCSSFEGDYGKDGYDEKTTGASKESVLEYAILASSAYVDGKDADAKMNNGVGREENWQLVNGIKPLAEKDVIKLLGGVSALSKSDLNVKSADGAVTITGREKDGLSVRVFERDGEIVLSFRGTADGKDVADDIQQASHVAMAPQQYEDAAKVLKAVLENPEYAGKKVVCTGHSLGGGLVQYAMAKNNIMDAEGKNSRVEGYVYNSAGLNGNKTIASLDVEKAQNAAKHIVGVRNDADPVSYVGFHLLQDKKMYEIKTDIAFSAEHSIKELIRNMAASMPTSDLTDKIVDNADRVQASEQKGKREAKTKETEAKNLAKQQKGGSGPTGGAAPVTQSFMSGTAAAGGGTALPYSLKDYLNTQISTDPNVQRAFDDAFDKVRIGLDTVLPASTAQTIADKLEELAKKGVISAGGAIDKAVQEQIDKLKAEILAQMPGDASKERMGKLIDDMIAGVGTGNFSSFGSDAVDLGAALAGDYASKLVDGLNLPADEKAALKKTISDAVQAYINGSGVGGSIAGNIEAYLYGKIQSQFGKDVADAWKNAYYALQGGKNPWADIGTAAKKTIESWAFQKLEKVIDASLKKLLDNHPVLAEMFKALGIDTGAIMGAIKNIWGVLTGSGDLATKFKELAKLAVDGLAKMLKSLVHWAVEKLQAWLNGFLSKIGKKIGDWIKDKLSDLLSKLHLSQSLIDKALKAVDAAINAGAKYVSSLPSKLESPIGGVIDKGAKKINEKISGKSAPSPSTPSSPSPTKKQTP